MKAQKIIVLAGLVIASATLFSFIPDLRNNEYSTTSLDSQEGFIVYATFDGKEDYGYNFVSKGKNEEDYTLTFQKVEDAVLTTYDLNSEELVGSKFKITFNRIIEVSKDENNMDDENEINTITKLEKL